MRSELSGNKQPAPLAYRPALASLLRSSATVALLASAGVAALAAPTTPEKFVLQYKAQAGLFKRVRGIASLNIAGKAKLDAKQVSKITFTKVDAATGDITYQDVTESSETAINGNVLPRDPAQEVSTATFHKNGLLVSFSSSTGGKPEDKEQAAVSARLFEATSLVYGDKPVGVGDKWSQDYKADAALGTRDAHADFTVTGVTAPTAAGGSATMQIKMTFAESGSGALSGSGTFTIEVASGDEIASDYNIEGYPIGDAGTAAGSIHSERIEGGPLPTSKNDAKAGAPPKDKTIDEIVKDGFEKLPGVITVWRKKDSGRDIIYAELREDQLNKLMMLQTTASTGNAQQINAGEPIDDLLFKFTKLPDDRIVMTVPNWQYRTTPNTPLEKAVRRSFVDSLLNAYKIEGKQADRKSYLIDISDLFKSDIAQISLRMAGGGGGPLGLGGGGGGYGLDREKTYIQSLKNYPENLVVFTQYNFVRGGRPSGTDYLADSRSSPIVISYNLFALPNDERYQPTNGYKPRKFDPRVGFFTTEYTDFSDDNKDDFNQRFIYRWDLHKKDPSAALSEPVKPITFWIDNAVPYEYRDAVRDGILMWNKAFEKIGYKNAVVAKQMPDNADWDPADMRYNTVRWLVTPEGAPMHGVSVAHFRPNPLTGQVLNAEITIDSSFTQFGRQERRNLIDPVAIFRQASGMDTEEQIAAGKVSISDRRRLLGDPRYCEAGGNESQQNAWLGYFADQMLLAPGQNAPQVPVTPNPDPDSDTKNPLARGAKYTKEYLRETVAHEMGHILGLRHNFVASTEFTLEQLKNPALVKNNGIGASVMDYNNFNISALRQKNVNFYSQTVGSYDDWAIQYGYTEIPSASTPDDEVPVLTRIASQDNAPGHKYQSDEQNILGFDPLVAQFDLTADPLQYWAKTLDLSRFLLENLDKRLPLPGQSYWEFTKAFNALLGRYAGAAARSTRYIGGLYTNRNHRGDPGEKPVLVPVEASKQRQALGLVNQYIFAPGALQFPERYYKKLTIDPNGDFSSALRGGGDFPVLDQLNSIQRTALRRIFSPTILTRVANNEFKEQNDPKNALTLPYLFRSVGDNVWADLAPNKSLPTLRRQLQRTYLDTMIDLVLKPATGPDDAKMLAWDTLKQLRPRLAAAQKGGGYDDYTRIHVADSLAKIDRVLNANIQFNASSGGGGAPSLLQLLLGGETRPAPTDTP